MAKDLNAGRPRTNRASGQRGTQPWDRWIVSPMHWSLGHAAPTSCHHKESSIFLPCYKNLALLWLRWHLLTYTGKVLLCVWFSEDLKSRSSFDTNDLSYYFQSITKISSIILLFGDNHYSRMALKHNTRYSIISFFFCLQKNKNRAGRIQYKLVLKVYVLFKNQIDNDISYISTLVITISRNNAGCHIECCNMEDAVFVNNLILLIRKAAL